LIFRILQIPILYTPYMNEIFITEVFYHMIHLLVPGSIQTVESGSPFTSTELLSHTIINEASLLCIQEVVVHSGP